MFLCCISSDLIFLFITLSFGITLSLVVQAFAFSRSADWVFVVSKVSVSELPEKSFQWLQHSSVDYMGPCYYQCHNLSLEMHYLDWFTTLITPGSESLLTYVGEFPLKSSFSSLKG